MFPLSGQPASSAVRKKCLIRSGIVAAGAGAISVATLVDFIRRVFPGEILSRLPQYEEFIYVALAITFITALPLTLATQVIWVSLSELGYVTASIYLIYSLLGVFLSGFQFVWVILLLVVIAVFVIHFIFFGGIRFAFTQRSWSDFVLWLVLLSVFAVVWIYPLLKAWGKL